MKTVLLKGLDKDAGQEVMGAFLSSLAFRKQLVKVLNEKIEAGRKASAAGDAYDKPNWALKQADTIGYERAIRECISLLTEK